MIERILFSHAIQRPHEERTAFVQAICAGCADLRDSVEVQIAAHEARKPGSRMQFEETTRTAASRTTSPPAE